MTVLSSVSSAAQGIYGAFLGLPLLAKAALAAIAAAALFFLFSRLRDNDSNNLRKARSLHERASSLHEKGQEDEAKLLFEKSDYHREKARMMKNEVV